MLCARASRFSVCALAGPALVVIGCVRDENASRRTREELVWDFTVPRSQPKLRLWPSSTGTPERLKRALTTENDRGTLVARVAGKDPYFVWRLEHEVSTRLVAVDVEASDAGALQLFWSSAACPTFRESCSLIEQLSAGRQWVDFLMDRSTEVRELRLDLPDAIGVSLWFHEIGVYERAELSARWVGGPGVELAAESYGLDLMSRTMDPWMTVTIPGLDASSFDSVELVLHGTVPTAPQFFWDGLCGHFDEACSVRLGPADSGALTHVARLARVASWRGRIRNLRLDPGDGAGEYTVDRIALTGEAPNAQRARR
jgi:hypothetical protein